MTYSTHHSFKKYTFHLANIERPRPLTAFNTLIYIVHKTGVQLTSTYNTRACHRALGWL